jgi:hypothetical protein
MPALQLHRAAGLQPGGDYTAGPTESPNGSCSDVRPVNANDLADQGVLCQTLPKAQPHGNQQTVDCVFRML